MVQLVERLLQGVGFRCTGCTDAAQALDLLRADPLRFEVVVTDYNMPEMSGLEVARAVALLHPGLPVVISTGHVSDTLRAEIDGAGVSALLRKENTFEELAALVHELLSGSAVARAPGS
jgi:CheY-like chemotaxis protein